MQMCDMTMQRGVTELKGRTTDEAFREQCFMWEKGASVGPDFFFFLSFKIFYMHKNLKKNTDGGEKSKKHNKSPLNCLINLVNFLK